MLPNTLVMVPAQLPRWQSTSWRRWVVHLCSPLANLLALGAHCARPEADLHNLLLYVQPEDTAEPLRFYSRSTGF